MWYKRCGHTSCSGEKSLVILKSLRISSVVLPFIIFATVLQPTSLQSRYSGLLHELLGTICSQKVLDIKVVGSEDELQEHLLIDVDKIPVPFADIYTPLAGLMLAVVRHREGLAAVVLAVLQDLIMRGGRSQWISCALREADTPFAAHLK